MIHTTPSHRFIGVLVVVFCGCLLSPVTNSFAPSSTINGRKQIVRGAGSPTDVELSDKSTTLSPITWEFQGHKCYAEISRPKSASGFRLELWKELNDKKPEIVLIHGFGCSTTYWRETRTTFTQAGFTVHSLDLLGQGKSAKPGRANNVEYSINLWAKMVEEYTARYIPRQTRVVLIGNSLGSTVALSAATGDHWELDSTKEATLPSRIQGIGMYNCGIGMNSRNLLKDPNLNTIQRTIFTFLFDALDSLVFGNIPFLQYILEDIVTKDLLRQALVGLYKCSPDPELRVDDSLIESFYLPAKDPGSAEALSQIYTNDAGKTPMQLHKDHEDFLKRIPVHLVWGTQDNVTPLLGPVGQFYLNLVENNDWLVSSSIIEAGHIPFDEIPECNTFMLQWLEDVVMAEKNSVANGEIGKFFQWPMPTRKFD